MEGSVSTGTVSTNFSATSGSYTSFNTTSYSSGSAKCSSSVGSTQTSGERESEGINILPSISEIEATPPSVSTAISTGQTTESSRSTEVEPDRLQKRRQSAYKHTTGLLRSHTSSPLIGVSSNLLQYNGPHCMDIQDERLEIKHGLHMDYTLKLGGHIKTVLYYPKKQSCTIVFSGGVHRYLKNELDEQFEEDSVTSDIDKLLHAAEFGVYVGVGRNKLKLLNRSFQCLCEVESPKRITAAVFNQWSGEVVTASPGKIMTWVFRQGAKSLAHSLTFSHGLLRDEEVHIIHLEPVPGNAQRIFLGVGCSVKIILMVSGKPLEYLKDIHSRPLSALLFFRPLRLLLTASKDGSIKVWNSSRELCATFVGHSGSVTALLPYPYGPMVVSCSIDTTIRVWDLCTFDQVQKVDNLLPLEGMCCDPGTYSILSYSSRQVKVWYIMQLYSQAGNIGSPCTNLQVTSHPLIPIRILAACADSAVRMVSPITGEVLTTALLPVERKITSMCYLPFEENLYVLDDCGSLAMFDTQDNPCSLRATWECSHSLGSFSCLAVYEMVMDEEEIGELLESDKWLGVTLEARLLSRHKMAEEDPLQLLREGQSLLLAGTTEGYVGVVNTNDGRVWFSAPGHEGPVVIIACNPDGNHIVSAGKDPMLNVWEVSPHSKEPLYLLCSFSLASPPSLLVASKDRLCVARNNPELSSYTLDMFNVNTKETFSADADYSHTDTITGVDVTHKMRLFASCSLDNTVRIWTEDNHPIRILYLDAAPDELVFCSQQADIILAMQSHLFTIANYTYFTENLHKNIVAFNFPELVSEVRITWRVDPKTLGAQDCSRLLLVDNTITQDSYSGDLSIEEMKQVEEAAKKKSSALSLISEREKEIAAISEGSITSSRSQDRVSLSKKEREMTWQRFLRLVRPDEERLGINIPEEDTFDPDASSEDTEEIFISTYSHWDKKRRSSFFPPLATFEPPYPIAPDGMLPNSVVLSKMRKSDADRAMAMGWKLPTISAKQRNLMQEMEEVEEEEEEEDDDVMKRLQAALAAPVESDVESPTPPSTPSPPPTPVKRVRVPKLKMFTPPPPRKPKTPPKVVTPTPTPPKTPTPSPSPPPTPLPEFITQFMGERWFEVLFPNVDSNTFPKPWTVTSFIDILLKKIVHPLIGLDIKADVCRVILQLLKMYQVRNRDDIYNVILGLVSGPPVLSTRVKYEKPLVMQALKLMFYLDRMDRHLTTLLMVDYIEGDEELRADIAEYFKQHGLKDPQCYFEAAMLKIPEVKKGVVAKGELAKAESLGTRTVHSRCEEWMQHWNEEYHTKHHSKHAKKLHPKKEVKKSGLKVPSKESSRVSFTDSSSKSSSIPAYDSVDVINYFVYVEHENAMARLRVRTPSPVPTPEPEEELKRNAILALPKITNRNRMLTRLGETHRSQCHPERETDLVLLNHLPPDYNRPYHSDSSRLWRSFTHYLNLALTPQNINPFLSEEEKMAMEEPTNRGSIRGMTKYFVQEKSIVRTKEQ